MTMQYRKGEIVGYVPLGNGDPVSVPLPQRWYILRVMAGRDAKVLEALYREGFSAYSATMIRTVANSSGDPARRRSIIKRLLPGLIFLPDFELARLGSIRSLDDVDDLLRVGPCLAWISEQHMLDIRWIAATNSVPLGKRKFFKDQLARIIAGPFAGMVGRIERLDSRGRLKLFIDAVMSGISFDATETQIEPVLVRKRPKTDRRRAKPLART